MSMLHPLLVPSTSNPSLSTLILPHESQFGGTRTLSLSMTLCLRACFFNSECMPRVECMSVGRELGAEFELYIKDAPSVSVSKARREMPKWTHASSRWSGEIATRSQILPLSNFARPPGRRSYRPITDRCQSLAHLL